MIKGELDQAFAEIRCRAKRMGLSDEAIESLENGSRKIIEIQLKKNRKIKMN